MKLLLLALLALLTSQAATPSLVGGVRISTDTTGTNTIAANVVVTNLAGGASRTALMLRDLQVTNSVKMLNLTANTPAIIGPDKTLTNGTGGFSASYDTISDMTNAVVTAVTAGVQVNRYSILVSDNVGGGQFYYDSVSAATPDGGTIFPPASGTGRYIRQLNGGPLTPQMFGARWNGVTDDTTPMQATVNALTNVGGGTLILPVGTGVVANIRLYSNIIVRGASRQGSVVKQANVTTTTNGVFVVNPENSQGSTNTADNQRNLVFENFTMIGRVVEDGFSEHKPLMKFNASSDVVIRQVNFLGYQGDGITIGGALFGGPQVERHNQNFIIKDCFFDGLTKANRNGISVIDCDGVSIRDSLFTRTSQSGMPGPIDFEPNYDLDIVRNMQVTGCTFLDNAGGFAIAVALGGNGTNSPFHGFIASDNYIGDDNVFDLGGGSISVQTAVHITNTTPSMGITIANNVILAGPPASPFILANVRGALVSGNTIRNGSVAVLSAYRSITNSVMDVTIWGNSFDDCGNTDGAIAIGQSTRIRIEENMFARSVPGTIAPISFLNGTDGNATSDDIKVVRNNFKGLGIAKTVRLETGYVQSRLRNEYSGNTIDPILSLDNDLRFNTAGTAITFYDSTFLPDTFITPTSFSTVSSDTGLPDRFHAGILDTRVFQDPTVDPYRTFMTQFYYAANFDEPSTVGLYFRKGNQTNDTWGLWHSFRDQSVIGQVANYSLQGWDGTVIFSVAPLTATLPNATNFHGKELTVMNIAPSGAITVTNATGAQTINGALSYSIPSSYDVTTFLSDGDNWWVTSSSTPPVALTNYVGLMLGNPNSAVTTGSTNFWVYPEANTLKTVTAHLFVTSSSGSVTFDLKKNGTTVLTAPVSIAAGSTNATASISVSSITAGDRLAGEITASGTDAYGALLVVGSTAP